MTSFFMKFSLVERNGNTYFFESSWDLFLLPPSWDAVQD